MNTPTMTDLLYLCHHLTDSQREEQGALMWGGYDADAFARSLAAKHGPSYVLYENDVPYCAAGFSLIAPGVANAWLIMTEAHKRHRLAIARHVRQGLKGMLTTVHRVQTQCIISDSCACLWHRVIGMTQDCVLKGYGANGEDFGLYSITRGGNHGRR
ncbi:MAG TPA: hypothetical protein VFP95_02450 [Gammaproteobacteria bacterium]|nr:hypothetical protein [Gammaproteobacteria bacterium]